MKVGIKPSFKNCDANILLSYYIIPYTVNDTVTHYLVPQGNKIQWMGRTC